MGFIMILPAVLHRGWGELIKTFNLAPGSSVHISSAVLGVEEIGVFNHLLLK